MDRDRLCAIMRHLIPMAEALGLLDDRRLRDLVNQTVDQMGPEDLLAMAGVADVAADLLRTEAGVLAPDGPPAPAA